MAIVTSVEFFFADFLKCDKARKHCVWGHFYEVVFVGQNNVSECAIVVCFIDFTNSLNIQK